MALSLGGFFGFRGQAQADEVRASTNLVNASGQTVGRVSLVESASKDVRLVVDVTGLTPGAHGMHVHAIGTCNLPDFASAGSHFNPAAHKHGLQTSDGPHAGDLPNLIVKADGSAHFEMTVARFTLSAGTTSLFDADGGALVIHADMDDGMSDPTGNSGGRVACGAITMGSTATAPVSAASVVSPPRTGSAGLASGLECAGAGCECCCCGHE